MHISSEALDSDRLVPVRCKPGDFLFDFLLDLFASQENAHCQVFFSKSRDALAHVWPRCPLYAFPPVTLLPQVLERIRENGCSVLLVAPFWKNQAWFPVLPHGRYQ